MRNDTGGEKERGGHGATAQKVPSIRKAEKKKKKREREEGGLAGEVDPCLSRCGGGWSLA